MKLITASPPKGGEWSALRNRWELTEESIDGGVEIIPPASSEVVHLPGGLWVELRRTLPEGEGRTLSVVIGSICAESAVVKELIHTYGGSRLSLQSVQLREISAKEA